MKNTTKISAGIVLGGASFMMMGCQPQTTINEKPNIIYILADDLGYGDVMALNPQSKIQTPTLDKMVNQGVSFTDAHSNSAVSTPTRYGTLTGQYTFRTRLKEGVLVGHSTSLMDPNRESVASLAAQNGYQTACIGKWHLGLNWKKKEATKPLYEGDQWDMTSTENVDYAAPVTGGPNDIGFNYSYIMPASLDIAPYVYLENGQVTSTDIQPIEGRRSDESRGIWYRKGDCASDFNHDTCLQHFTQKAIDFIDDASQKDNPFFLYFPLTAPHTPWLPSEEFIGKSGAGYYGDFVCMVDDVVKQIYESLEKNGVADNTIVVFTSDNGSHWLPSDIKTYDHRANGIYSGMKSDAWEGGHRVPFIVTWPKGIKEAKQSDQLLCSTDLMATMAEMLNVTLTEDAGEDSFSFWNEISTNYNPNVQRRESMIYHSIEGYFGYREGDWVMLDCKGSGGWSLTEAAASELPPFQIYNLKEDPKQTNNQTELTEKFKTMKSKMTQIVESGRSR